jgi:hypothetical protein
MDGSFKMPALDPAAFALQSLCQRCQSKSVMFQFELHSANASTRVTCCFDCVPELLRVLSGNDSSGNTAKGEPKITNLPHVDGVNGHPPKINLWRRASASDS